MPAVISMVLSILLLLFLIWLSWWLANQLAAAIGAMGKWVLIAYYACALIIIVLIIAGQIPLPLHLIQF